MEPYPDPYEQEYAEMEPYPGLCLLVRDNKFKVTNMQSWGYPYPYVSDNM